MFKLTENIKDGLMSIKLCQLSPNNLNDSKVMTLRHQRQKNTFKYMKHAENTVVLSEIPPTEVHKTKKYLNNKQSTDMFGLSNVILKSVDPAICEILCDVFYKCFDFMN